MRFEFTVGVLFVWIIASHAAAAPQRPNIIVILTDDQGYQDLGCFGSATIQTPRLDRMADEGIRFTAFYAQAVCGPSRAALMTGCYPIRIGEPGNLKRQHTVLHSKETTMAEVLAAAGYKTACIGKWHLGLKTGSRKSPGGGSIDVWSPGTMPRGQGFDYFFGTPLYNGFTAFVEQTKFRSPILRNEGVVVPSVESWDEITKTYTREAVEFIRENRAGPFFLYLAHNMPHVPLGASEKFRGKSKYGLYGDAIEEIDWSTGRILDTLAECDIDENTLIVYTSDNGPWIETTRGNDPAAKPCIPRDHSGTADPLRGYKMLTWEGGLRVPCIVRWPGRIPAGKTCEKMAATIDLLPTFAEVAGASLPKDRTIDGRSILPLIEHPDEAESPREFFCYYCYTHLQAIRDAQWKLVFPRPEHPKWTGWSGRFKGNGVKSIELYDLTVDVSEARDVASEHPDVVERLSEAAEGFREELGDYNRIGRGARFFDEGERRKSEARWMKDKAR